MNDGTLLFAAHLVLSQLTEQQHDGHAQIDRRACWLAAQALQPVVATVLVAYDPQQDVRYKLYLKPISIIPQWLPAHNWISMLVCTVDPFWTMGQNWQLRIKQAMGTCLPIPHCSQKGLSARAPFSSLRAIAFLFTESCQPWQHRIARHIPTYSLVGFHIGLCRCALDAARQR